MPLLYVVDQTAVGNRLALSNAKKKGLRFWREIKEASTNGSVISWWSTHVQSECCGFGHARQYQNLCFERWQ
ncbi:MAG TPA: hypothetical protein DCS87_05825 [Rheinheimera sp.]|nr:hypothetical protein [Rheinheimera sp.]